MRYFYDEESWSCQAAMADPQKGLTFLLLKMEWVVIVLSARMILSLDIPELMPNYPDLQDVAPEFGRYCTAEKGMRVVLKAEADKHPCIMKDWLYSPGEHYRPPQPSPSPFYYLRAKDLHYVRLIYAPPWTYGEGDEYRDGDDDCFLEVNIPHISRYIDGYGEPRGNQLQNTWIDEAGNLVIDCLGSVKPDRGQDKIC